MYHDVFIAGTGGQGILLIGNMLAEAALAEGRSVTFLPSYGVEMRGGNANCTVVISDREIGSPSVTTPQVLIAMSKKARALYEGKVMPGGLMILNISLAPAGGAAREDIEVMELALNDLAAEMGDARLANMIALGAYLGGTPVVSLESVEAGMEHALSERNRRFIPLNMDAIRKGVELSADGR